VGDCDDIAVRFRQVASRWDLRSLHDEVAKALSDLDAASQPYVPSQLVLALDKFLDSYGERPK